MPANNPRLSQVRADQHFFVIEKHINLIVPGVLASERPLFKKVLHEDTANMRPTLCVPMLAFSGKDPRETLAIPDVQAKLCALFGEDHWLLFGTDSFFATQTSAIQEGENTPVAWAVVRAQDLQWLIYPRLYETTTKSWPAAPPKAVYRRRSDSTYHEVPSVVDLATRCYSPHALFNTCENCGFSREPAEDGSYNFKPCLSQLQEHCIEYEKQELPVFPSVPLRFDREYNKTTWERGSREEIPMRKYVLDIEEPEIDAALIYETTGDFLGEFAYVPQHVLFKSEFAYNNEARDRQWAHARFGAAHINAWKDSLKKRAEKASETRKMRKRHCNNKCPFEGPCIDENWRHDRTYDKQRGEHCEGFAWSDPDFLLRRLKEVTATLEDLYTLADWRWFAQHARDELFLKRRWIPESRRVTERKFLIAPHGLIGGIQLVPANRNFTGYHFNNRKQLHSFLTGKRVWVRGVHHVYNCVPTAPVCELDRPFEGAHLSSQDPLYFTRPAPRKNYDAYTREILLALNRLFNLDKREIFTMRDPGLYVSTSLHRQEYVFVEFDIEPYFEKVWKRTRDLNYIKARIWKPYSTGGSGRTFMTLTTGFTTAGELLGKNLQRLYIGTLAERATWPLSF